LSLGLKSPLLDAGCGYGYFTACYADRFDRVMGIDFSQRRIAGAVQFNQKSNITYAVRDLAGDHLDLEGRFNTVVSSAVLQHVLPNLRAQVFRNIHGVSMPGAVFVLYDEVGNSEDPSWDGFYAPISPQWIQREVATIWNLASDKFLATGLQNERVHRLILERVS
jgi:SAM-dependent methyltransferase